MIQLSHFWEFIWRTWKHYIENIIYNNQDMEATYVSTNGWMDKENVVFKYNGILLIHKRLNIIIWYSINESWGVMLNEMR